MSRPMPTRLVIAAARLWDGLSDALLEPGYVLVQGERIMGRGQGSVPNLYAQWPRRDLGDATLLPGLIDAHVHLSLTGEADPTGTMARETSHRTALRAARHARDTLDGGITAVRDCGGRDFGDIALRDAIAAGELRGPLIRAAGRAICMTGGHGWFFGRQADGIDDCRRAAREQLQAGADFVKVMATGGVLTAGSEAGLPQLELEELAAAVGEARKAGKPAAAHAQGLTGARQAVLAGVSSLEHGVDLSEELIELMARREVFLVPTFSAPQKILAAAPEGKMPRHVVDKTLRLYEAHEASFRRALAGGVRVAMGSDAGTPANRHGDNLDEVAYLVRAGMRVVDAWRAATTGSASLLGLSGTLGSVDEGLQADLVAISGDAMTDVESLPGRVVWVMHKGAVVKDRSGGGVRE